MNPVSDDDADPEQDTDRTALDDLVEAVPAVPDLSDSTARTDLARCVECGTHGQQEINVRVLSELTLGDVNMLRQQRGHQLFCSLDCLDAHDGPTIPGQK